MAHDLKSRRILGKRITRFGFFIAPIGLAWSLLIPQARAAGPCQPVVQACKSAGFILGAWKQGKGLWVDCINPIMQGVTAPHATLALPSVPPAVIANCKAQRPHFGQGKIGP